MASEEKLLEEVRRLRSELSEKLQELEERIRRIEGASSPSKIIAINWMIAHIEASAHRILSLARNTFVSAPAVEKDLRDYFCDLEGLVKIIEKELGEVDWKPIKSCTSVVIHAAKTAGLPFRVVASIAIEKLGRLAAEAIDENAVKEAYGLVDLDYWKQLISRFK